MIRIEAALAKRFSITALMSAIILLCAVIAFNIVVDPYGMYRLVTIEGFNQHKPAVYNRVRLMKAYDVRRIKPRSIILGTSRTHLGLRPSHPAWRPDDQPVYNLAFDGAMTKEMFHYLRHAHAVQPLKQVVLGLDTYHATTAPASHRSGFDEQLLLDDDTPPNWIEVLLADLKLLISFDTLLESIHTVGAQQHANDAWFAPDGQRLGEIFFHQPWEAYQTEGPRAYFDKIDTLDVRYKLEWRIPTEPTSKPNRKPVPESQAETLSSLDYIQRIIAFCRDNNISLRIFFTPSHAHQMELSAATGGWSSVERGKRALVRLLSEDAAAHPGQEPFVLHDFSAYSSVTTEPLPPRGSRKAMNHYWDSSHFKANVGDLVLNRLFGVGAAPTDFGIRLTPDNIDQALADIRAQQNKYRATHSESVALIRGYVEAFKRAHNIPDWE